MLKYKILWWQFTDRFSNRSRIRRLERQFFYLDKKLEAFICVVEDTLKKND